MRIRSILSAVALAGVILPWQPARAVVSETGRDAVFVTDVVDYQCVTTGETGKQDVKIKIELTMPAAATTGQQMIVGWRGTYADDAGALKAPATGLAAGTKLYAYASISGLAGVTSATGVGELAALGAGQVVSLPKERVSLKTTSANAGTATVRPAALTFGTGPTEPSIRCEVRNAAALTTFPLTVVSAGDRPATPTPAPTNPPPAPAVTVTMTESPEEITTEISEEESGEGMKTPSGGAATGGGGASGPDARMLVLTGLLLAFTAGAGLLLRRRSLPGG